MLLASSDRSAVRRSLRERYLREIIAAVPVGGTIIDFGCGVGWLTILLAQLGAKQVIGVDNSPAQIELAQRAAADAGVEQSVHFTASVDDAMLRGADAIVFHGVLHHLTWQEFDALFAGLSAKLREGTRILIFEPVFGSMKYFPWSAPLWLIKLAARLRYQSPAEQHLRRELARRGEGPRLPGYGVSPKETPFRVGEIEARLAPKFRVAPGKPILFNSVLVAMELLLLEKTNPAIGRICLRWLLPLYGKWERLSFRLAPKSLWRGWVFCLFRGQK